MANSKRDSGRADSKQNAGTRSRSGHSKSEHFEGAQGWPIEQLPGLSAVEQQTLRDAGICTTAELLSRTQTPALRQAFSQELGLHLKYVGKWAALADLARVPGVGCDYCGLLLHSGIASVAMLAGASVHRLHPQVMRLYVANLRRRDLTPTAGQVAQWIAQAKQLV